MFRTEMDTLRRPECMATTIAGFNATRFFLWGHMKSLGYQDTVEDLPARVPGAGQLILQTSGVMERVCQNMIRRCNMCNKLGDRHTEPLL